MIFFPVRWHKCGLRGQALIPHYWCSVDETGAVNGNGRWMKAQQSLWRAAVTEHQIVCDAIFDSLLPLVLCNCADLRCPLTYLGSLLRFPGHAGIYLVILPSAGQASGQLSCPHWCYTVNRCRNTDAIVIWFVHQGTDFDKKYVIWFDMEVISASNYEPHWSETA